MPTAAWQEWLTAQWERPSPGSGARLLQPLSWLYGALVAANRSLYTAGLLATVDPPRPTIVVGNLVAGGAGKTPAVIAIVDLLRANGHRPGVVSRGYGRSGAAIELVEPDGRAAELGDEPLLIRLRTGAPVAVGADRIAAARALCARHPEVDVIVSDDGLQHLRLGRQVEVLVVDERGFGNGLLLPAGPLRQPPGTAALAPRLVLYSAGRASTSLTGFVGTRRLRDVLGLADWWTGRDADACALSALRGRALLAAAGLARPRGFFAMLEAEGLRIRPLPLPDHCAFDPLPWPADTADVVVTEKDAVKLQPRRIGATRVWVARLDFDPEPAFGPALLHLLTPTPP